MKPGAKGHPYEVRSVQQLRFINWNCSNKNTTTWEESGTYQNFPYLMKADAIDKTAVQKSPSKSTGTNKNKLLYWEQTHDLQGDGVTDYVPIAAHSGHSTSASQGGYTADIYGWFGGTCDGGTYAIRNLNITSGCYAVGLFSVTVGANFKNVVLYSDRGSVIERSGCKAVGAYSIGGLIGLALDYTAPDFDNTIENCAIAGYIIRDKSDQDPSMGECNLGGMIGIAKIKLRNCSAVTDIQVMPQYNLIKWSSWETDPATGVYHPTAKSGNTNDTGGISSSEYTPLLQNINGISGSDGVDGESLIENCYTYMEFPRVGGTVLAVSMLGSVADRYYGINHYGFRGTDSAGKSYEDGVYYVKVTANLKVSADPAEIPLHQVPDNDKEHQSVALQATSQTGEKNYSAWDNCEWTVNALTDNLVELTSVTDGAFEVYAWFPGDTMIRCDCNFDYHGLCTCTGTAFTHVYIKEAAMIGLGTGSAFNEALIRTGNKTVAGSDVGYARNAFGELVGPLPMDGSGNPVGSLTVPYLYGLKEDGVLGGGYTIEKITLGGETVYENGLPVNGEKYAVSISEVSSDSTYNYITLHPATVLEEDQTGVQMVVLVSKGETKYQLKVKVTAPAAPHVTANFYEQESSVNPVKKQLRIEANKDMPVTLPSLGHSTALHAANTGWHWIESSGTRKTGKVGSVVTLPFEDMNLYADWESDWEVSYDANGYGTAPAMSYVERGKSVTLPSMGDVGDLRHVGWSDGSRTYDKGSAYTPTGNVTLKAVWKPIYTITLVSTVEYGTPAKAGVKYDGKTYYSTDTPNTIRVAEGEQISVINNTLEHYTFVNWKDDSGRTAAPGESYTVRGNTTLTANWQKWYMLSLNPNGGKIDGSTDPKELWVEPGKECTLPDLGVQNWSDHNYRHVTWNDTYAAGESITPTGDMYLSADWTIVYYATFVGNGGTISGDAKSWICPDDPYTFPSVAKEHYTFNGWKDNASGTVHSAGETITPDANLSLTAQWLPDWKVTLDANGGTLPDGTVNPIYVHRGDSTPLTTPTKTLSKFKGWKDNLTGTVFDAGNITPNSDMNLTAQWEADYVITLDKNGGNLNCDGTIYVHRGESIALPTTPTRNNYRFEGWSTNGTKANMVSITDFKPTANVTLKAVWARKRTVTFTTSIADNYGIGQLLNVKYPRASDVITVSSSSEGAIWDNTSAGGNTWGGSSKTLDKADGDTIIIPSGSYTRGGNTYTIAYWTIGRTRYYPGDSYTIDGSNVTMEATWQ